MIQVDDLSISYGDEPVLENASFTINPGERCGLVGRNGSGKSTLFRILTGKEKQDKGTISLSKGYRLGYLDQHIRFTAPTVLEEAALGLPEDERDSVYKAEAILFGLGFKAEDMDVPTEKMSGGYHLRLHLAKVLLSEPDCLLLDEPTNYLDILSLRFLGKLLHGWPGELILISHDREFMDGITTHTLGIHRKQVRKVKGGSTEFYSHIILEEEIHERTRANLEKKRAHLQSYIDRFGAKASKAAQAQSRRKMLGRIPAMEELKSLYNLDFNFHEAPFHGKRMVEAIDVEFAYPNQNPIIPNFSLMIERGERVAIIGKNGYGKSTLLRLLAKELSPQAGDIKTSEQAMIGYFGQTNIQRLMESRSIEEEISNANPQLSFSDVRRICGQMMFSGDLAKKKIGVLSGGEKSRVLLGKILAKPCNILLLDEPTHHLDIESVEALIDALEDFEGAFIVVTHSELMLKRLELQKLVVCHKDRQDIFLGGYEDFLEKEGWEEEGPRKVKKTGERKEDRRKQADFINQRAKAIKPIEEEIKRCEAKIMQLEEQVKILHQNIVDLSQKDEPNKLQELLKKSGEGEREIQALYDKLFKLNEELEAKKLEF